jgi:UDP-2,3-diacylglucosamine hydrolase
LFVSDIHLQESEPAKTAIFLRFLAGEALQADALYILGDLFEAWIGDDDNSEFNQNIIAALKKCSNKTPIYLMRGNRDFLLGNKFAAASGCTLIPDPYVIDINGTKAVLTHGDILCTKDVGHLRFRKFSHNSTLQKMFLTLPLGLRRKIANWLRRKSKQGKLRKSMVTKNVTEKAAIELMQQYNAKLLIHGHIHKAGTYKLKRGERIVLSEWKKRAEYRIFYGIA